ncbi:MAG: flagellar export protein FliJ [Bdellovibrio sp.]|nr:flagellar export protein FliJ [Bdellovibrio sp.]
MKKFRFKFDHVLHLRKTREDEALRVLAAAQEKHQQQLRLKNYYLSEIDKAFASQQTIPGSALNLSQITATQEFIEGTKLRVQFADQAIVRAVRWVEKAMWSYFQAKKQRRILETLYEKQFRDHKEALKRAELRQQDDLTVMRFQHRQGEE